MESLDEFTPQRRLAAAPGSAPVLFTGPACGACWAVARRPPETAPARVGLYKVDVQQALAQPPQEEP